MAIDQYAICPCGSGKKIKFCKCFDSIGELDRVMKMVQGGQMVAALDRLNQIFKQHPTAAWTLAIKGRLLLSMNELSTLEENADRFIRLQPSNPLALAQKAAAQSGQGKLTQAAHSILEALAESGQSVDSLIIEICGILAVSLMRAGNLLSARMFATIALMASQDEQFQQLPRVVLEELNGSPQVNLLLKTLPTTVARPANVPWGERFDEAQSLLYSNQILASESKLEALDRQHPNEPAIMMSLFVCAIWRADTDAQARLLAKVSAALDSDQEKSTRLLALSWLLGSKTQSLDVPSHSLSFEIDDADKAILEITAEPRFDTLQSVDLNAVTNEDGIHPRAAYAVLDREPQDDQAVTKETIGQLAQIVGIAFVFGRQTDKPPQLRIRQIFGQGVESTKELVSKVFPNAKPTSSGEEPDFLPLSVALSPRIFLPKQMRESRLEQDVIEQLHLHHFQNHFAHYQLPCFENKSLSELANDPATLKQRTALMRVVQGDMAMLHFHDAVSQFSESVGVKALPGLSPKNDDELEMLPAFDLPRVSVEQLDNDSLFYYFERSSQVGLTDSAIDAAKKIVALENGDDETSEMIMRAYVMLISNTLDHDEALQYSKDAKAWCGKNNFPDASVLLTTLPRYLMAQDPQGFSTSIQEIQTKYGNNPEVMTHLTRMLIDFGILNPDGSPRRSAAPPPKAQSGLWTGDGPAAAPTIGAGPGAEPAPSEGGSKLWLPGMD